MFGISNIPVVIRRTPPSRTAPLLPRLGIFSGLLLCIDTAFALFGSISKAPLLFIPMILGIPILFFGVVALNPHRRRQALATAASVGSVGFLVGCGQLFHLYSLWRNLGQVNLHDMRIIVWMVAICLTFLASYLWNVTTSNRLRPFPFRKHG